MPRTPALIVAAILGLSLMATPTPTVAADGDDPPGQRKARATGLRVVVQAPAAARGSVKVVVRGPKQGNGKAFKRTIRRTTTWAGVAPGTYRIRAARVTMHDQRLVPTVTKREVTVPRSRARRTSKVRYPAPVFCATEGSRLHAWGDNVHGQLGTAAGGLAIEPVRNRWLRGATAVTGGARSTYALCGDGTVWAWGDNSYGQLGIGSTSPRHWPVRIRGLRDVVQVAAGEDAAYALTADGAVWAWGNGRYGQLGNGESGFGTRSTVPVRVQVGGPVEQIAVGSYAAYALRADTGQVEAWGNGGVGQMGDATTAESNPVPTPVSGLADVREIAAGDVTAYAVTDAGALYAWGGSNQGEIPGVTPSAPVPVASGSADRLWAGGSVAYRVLAGTLESWGSGRFRDVGRDTGGSPSAPGPVESLPVDGLTEIVAGEHTAYALLDTGLVWAWGDHHRGQVGDGSPVTPNSHNTGGLLPRLVPGLSDVVAVGAGGVNGYAITPE